jgi:hypothetical protein
MRRIALYLVLFALVALAGGSSTAAAAPAETLHFQFNGSFAEALWETQTSTSFTDTFVFAQQDRQGATFLFLDQFTANFDKKGNFTGATDVFGEADSGVSFSIGKSLSSATASATVPVTSCSYDADFNLIGCSDAGTIDVSAGWTGEGPIARGTFNDNFQQDGFHEVDHFTGTNRQATANVTVDGTSLGTGDLLFADLGTAVSGTVIICHNC